MKDYNFFSVYIDDKKADQKKKVYAITIGVILACLVTGLISHNFIRIKQVKQDIEGIENYINNPKIAKTNTNIISTKLTIKLMKEYSLLVEEIGNELNEEYLKYMDVFEIIDKSTPEKMYISQLDINRDTATISGTTADRTKVAYFQHNLRAKKDIRDVIVTVIHNDEDQKKYSYNIKCYFKDVIEDESN